MAGWTYGYTEIVSVLLILPFYIIVPFLYVFEACDNISGTKKEYVASITIYR